MSEIKRKYAVKLEQEILDAEAAYVKAVIELQKRCKHRTVLEHIDADWEQFRVCEDCGATSRAPWSSPVHAFGNMEVFEVERAYKVGWTEFAQATPKIIGWCQKRDNPATFSRGGRLAKEKASG